MNTPSISPSGAADGLPANGESSDRREQELQQIRDALRGLRFGSVNVIVQDGVVVQIDRTEKHRLRQASSTAN